MKQAHSHVLSWLPGERQHRPANHREARGTSPKGLCNLNSSELWAPGCLQNSTREMLMWQALQELLQIPVRWYWRHWQDTTLPGWLILQHSTAALLNCLHIYKKYIYTTSRKIDDFIFYKMKRNLKVSINFPNKSQIKISDSQPFSVLCGKL